MKNDKWLELTNGVCWSIIFSLAAIIMSVVALAHTHPRVLYSADDKTVVLGFDYIGVIVAILALLVTFLVAWQIYSTIRATRQIENVEEDFEELKSTVDKTIEDKVSTKINVLEREASAMICFTLAKSPVHLHQFSEALNERFGTNGITNMLNQSLYYYAAGLDNLSKLDNSENYDDLYEGLTATISLIEGCERSLELISIGVVDAVINGIKADKNPHDGKSGEGVNKKDLIARLEKIKDNVITLKHAKEQQAKKPRKHPVNPPKQRTTPRLTNPMTSAKEK